MLVYRLLPVILCAGTSATAGLLVLRSGNGIQFSESAAVLVNAKDKALAVGAQPKVAGAAGNFPAVPLNGVLIKDTEANALCLYDWAGGKRYLAPQPAPKKGAVDLAALWGAAKISYKKAPSDKTPEQVALASFIAFLPGGVEDLARLSMDQNGLALIGGKSGYFPAQVELIAAAARNFGSEKAMAAVETYVEGAMRRCYDQFDAGIAGMDVLQQGLQVAKLSAEAYPKALRQEQLRTALAAKKAWTDQEQAVLRAMFAGKQWDAFLLAYAGFEKYAWSLSEIVKQHHDALQQSLDLHKKAGDERSKMNEHFAAWREFRLAGQRQPSDKDVQTKTAKAWAEYSSQYALDHQRDRAQLSVGDRNARDTALGLARLNKADNKLDEALKHVEDAAKVDPASVDVLYAKADILSARGETARGLKTLDEYDLHAATEDEQKKGLALRTELQHQLEKLGDRKAQVRRDWEGSSFGAARVHAIEALRTREDDPEILYYAGVASLVTRHSKEAREYLAQYLQYSDTLDGDQTRRGEVRRLAANAADAAPDAPGERNWLSGKKLPDGVYYCPISLAFQPRVARISTSAKLTLDFNWDNGGRLGSIVPSVEKNARIIPPKQLYFTYADQPFPQLFSAGFARGAPAPAEPDAAVRNSSVVLLNNPHVDPTLVKQLTGKDVAVVLAGDRFFNPFSWDNIYHFRVRYDEQGRIGAARLMADREGGAEAPVLVEFEWDGPRLMAVRGYDLPGGSEKDKAKVYERTLTYREGKLIEEEIHERGATNHIKYTYNGDDLVSAEWDKDAEGRSRRITFVSSAGLPRRK